MRSRRIWIGVFCVLFASAASAQIAKRRPISKGPRATGLVELDSKGGARLVPVVIMVDGKFYDASAYKADPVPMALQSGTVYEAVQSGVSKGLFTVNNVVPQKGWVGFGTWKTNEQIAAEKEKAQARASKLSEKHEDDLKAGGPPRLSRTREGAHPKKEPAPANTGSAPQKPADEESDRPVLRKPVAAPAPAAESAVDSPDRPLLRRQGPGEAQEQTKITPDTTSVIAAKFDVVPAISDAEGPQPRPYTYQTKPEEVQDFMKKMSAMAADEVKRRMEMFPGGAAKSKTIRAAAPEFREQQLKVLDISGTNEAVLVYSATATIPARADVQFSTTVVARQDIYADLHKVFAQTTDNNHLDMQPRYEFIDAVDADGDGRGELLFKQVGVSGTGYALYRIIGDRLWPLFQSKPGS